MSTKRPAVFPARDKRPAKRAKPSKARAQLSVRTPAVASGPKQVGAGSAAIAKDARPLPGGLDVEQFIKARAHEVSALQEAMRMAASRLTTRAFQSLPRHLRRRAASHNPRRVPTRLREKARMEIDSKDKTVKLQQKKAKAKRKVTVADVYRYRQRDKTWLETHVWHAKRMHMVDLWGYRLARTPTRKSRRPAFRAARHACIISDISYSATIEISGTRDDIVAMLKRCLGIAPWAGSKYESGARQAQTTFHEESAWPAGLIGPVDVLWRGPGSSSERQVWLRMHPAMFDEAWKAIRSALSAMAMAAPPKGDAAGDYSIPGSSLEVRDLRGSITSLDIMGPHAGSVIHSITKLERGQGEQRVQLWNSLAHQQSSASLPDGLIISVEAQDPRLIFPPHREKVDLTKTTRYAQSTNLDLASSRLWDSEAREGLLKPRYTKAQLDARRHQSGEPGKRLAASSTDNRIPLILVQQSHQGQGSETGIHGYTLLAPAGWAMPLWQSLVFTGAHAAGIDERRIQQAEMAKPSFPDCYPATQAGEEWQEQRAEAEIRRWRKRPPAKRLSTLGLGVQQGWKPDWNLCLPPAPDSQSSQAGPIASHKPWLLPLGGLLAGSDEAVSDTDGRIGVLRHKLGLVSNDPQVPKPDLARCLLQVSLECSARGRPAVNAAIFRIADADDPESLDLSILPDSRPMGFILYGGTSMLRGHGYGMGAVSCLSYLEEERRQGAARKEGIRVVYRNRGEPYARYAIVRVAI